MASAHITTPMMTSSVEWSRHRATDDVTVAPLLHQPKRLLLMLRTALQTSVIKKGGAGRVVQCLRNKRALSNGRVRREGPKGPLNPFEKRGAGCVVQCLTHVP